MKIRLQKWISQSGVASRRKAEELILSGHVAVNGEVVTELGTRADTNIDTVTVNGHLCVPVDEKIYIALYKPEGVVTTKSDPFDRPTVMDYIPADINCYPVGRLDYDTSGLLLLTNDGALAQQLAHPKYEITKTYIAVVRGLPSKESLSVFREGLMIDGRRTALCEVEILGGKKEPNATLRIKLHEGRNRQVRKMCDAIGHKVISLKRVEVGPIKLGGLQKGHWRKLSEKEVALFSNP